MSGIFGPPSGSINIVRQNETPQSRVYEHHKFFLGNNYFIQQQMKATPQPSLPSDFSPNNPGADQGTPNAISPMRAINQKMAPRPNKSAVVYGLL